MECKNICEKIKYNILSYFYLPLSDAFRFTTTSYFMVIGLDCELLISIVEKSFI